MPSGKSSRSSVDTRDIYYRLTKASSYRARSAFKLLHLDEEFDLFTGVRDAVDLCAAPGSWSQVLGERLKPGKGVDDPRVVSVDLQSMAPIPNITILQTDITLPSTIPLVLRALGGRKADLVVCDGAPDVTGVHDLDAYLHSQLLLAALTLALTLLAPRGTLIFKIFLSPLDPQAAILRSQLELFFSRPISGSSNNDGEYAEFDIEQAATDAEPASTGSSDRTSAAEMKGAKSTERQSEGYDKEGRRGGVWVRKPRSSRKGSGEAFIICRNFDPSVLPLPPTFSSEALDNLAKQTSGTLTLESLATLVPSGTESSPAWEILKGYVGGGDLNTMSLPARSLKLQVPTSVQSFHRKSPPPPLSIVSPGPSQSPHSHSPAMFQGHPTPLEGPSDFFAPSRTHSSIPKLPRNLRDLAPTERGLKIADTRAFPSSSSPTLSSRLRIWEVDTTSLPSPNPPDGFRSEQSYHTPSALPSPALSTSSKTDIFFGGSSADLPTPPRPLSTATSLGRGLPSTLQAKGHGRAISMPSQLEPGGDVPHPRTASAMNTPSRPVSTIVPGQTNLRDSPAMRLFGENLPSTPLSTFPTLPRIQSTPTPPRPKHQRRVSQIERETREVASDEIPLQPGDELEPIIDVDLPLPFINQSPTSGRWKLLKKLGEGAFSSVWRGENTSTIGSERGRVAIKLTPKSTTTSNARTRIAFLRECSVLRHISHPNIVGFVEAFSTGHHCVLILEELRGGELWDLVGEEVNKKRMALIDPSEIGGEVDGNAMSMDRCSDGKGEGFVRRIIGELCRGVGWLHKVGIVHRDIKLENILFTINPFALPPTSTGSIPLQNLPKPLIKLTDFGLSRFINPLAPLLETRCGSELFAAPEIIMGRPYDGRMTDSWALGVVLYGLIAGELPFDGPSAMGDMDEGMKSEILKKKEAYERKKKMMRIARGKYAWKDGVGGEGVRRVVDGLLKRDPAERWSIGRVWDDEWMSGIGGVAVPEESWDDLGIATDQGNEGIGKTGKRRILDGYLLDEEVGEIARAEMEL